MRALLILALGLLIGSAAPLPADISELAPNQSPRPVLRPERP